MINIIRVERGQTLQLILANMKIIYSRERFRHAGRHDPKGNKFFNFRSKERVGFMWRHAIKTKAFGRLSTALRRLESRRSPRGKKDVGESHASRQLTGLFASTMNKTATHSRHAVRSQTMNLVSSSGSDLVEDDDNDGCDGPSQRHAPRDPAIGKENDRSPQDRIAIIHRHLHRVYYRRPTCQFCSVQFSLESLASSGHHDEHIQDDP